MAHDYRVTARTDMNGAAEVEMGRSLVPFDARWGDDASGLAGPAEMLCAAFAACLLKNLERVGQLMPFSYETAEVTVTAYRRDVPPSFSAFDYEMTVVTDEPPERVQLLHRNLRKFGTVYNTLSAVCDISGKLVPVPRLLAGDRLEPVSLAPGS